jgi:hypothetical protein
MNLSEAQRELIFTSEPIVLAAPLFSKAGQVKSLS